MCVASTLFILGLTISSIFQAGFAIIHKRMDFTNTFSQARSIHSTSSSSSCDNPFQIWPILNVEKEVILQEHPTEENNIHEAEAKKELSQACPRTFRPVHFFTNPNSPGFEYLNHLKHLERAAVSGTKLARIGMHHSTIIKATKDKDKTDRDSEIHKEEEEFHLLYNSVPKSATTSIIKAMENLDKKLENSEYLNGSYKMIWSDDENSRIMEEMEREWNSTTTASSSLPLPPKKKKYRLFGIVREPVSRFVSTTAQEMTIETARNKAKEFRELCLKDNERDTLQCAIETVRAAFTKKIPETHTL